MKVVYSWLKEFFEPGALDSRSAEEIGEILTGLGLVCESVDEVGYSTRGVVVAEIKNVRPHPSADKIRIADVDAGPTVNGGEDTIQICCGAPNLTVGDKVPLATVGTVLPNGMEIAPRKMRGEESNGMLCGADEIGLPDDGIDGLHILDADLEVGVALEDGLNLESDFVFDLDIEGNRPDALSVLGVARDLAGKLGLGLVERSYNYEASGPDVASQLQVKINDKKGCPRFGARVLAGFNDAESPSWMKDRLLSAGMRPISTIVDISNYVMLELGQPNHTYDLDLVADGVLQVRQAIDGEALTTLDGVDRKLSANDLVVCDGQDTAVGLAGVMGGASTEITDSTQTVILEAAVWDPMTIAKTVRRLNLRSEASTRFERGADPQGIERALDRFCQLANEICNASVSSGTVLEIGEVADPAEVAVRTARLNMFLNSELSDEEVKNYLDPIGFITQIKSPGHLSVSVPSWRPDSSIEEDIFEEVGRHYGYDKIGKRVPRSPKSGYLTDDQIARRRLHHTARALGHSEAMPLPFVAPEDLEAIGTTVEPIALSNPLVAAESVLRTSLLPGLLKAVAYNQSHRHPRVSLYEIGKIFSPSSEELPVETDQLAFIGSGYSADGTAVSSATGWLASLMSTLKLGDYNIVNEPLPAMHPTRSGSIVYRGKAIGAVGEVSLDVLDRFGVAERCAWLCIEVAPLVAAMAKPPKLKEVSRYPSTDIDLAFTVAAEVPASQVESALRSAAGELLDSIELFDTFYETVDSASRSLAYRLRLQSAGETLSEDQISNTRNSCIETVVSKTGASLRD